MKALNEGEAMQKQAFYRLSCFSEDVKVVVLIFFEDLLFGKYASLDGDYTLCQHYKEETYLYPYIMIDYS